MSDPAVSQPIHLRLLGFRREAKFTQAGLAKRLGCSVKKITHVERANRLPSIDFIEHWAAACGRLFVMDFPAFDGSSAQPDDVAGASLGVRRVIAELLKQPAPSDASLRALEAHVAAWRAMGASATTPRA